MEGRPRHLKKFPELAKEYLAWLVEYSAIARETGRGSEFPGRHLVVTESDRTIGFWTHSKNTGDLVGGFKFDKKASMDNSVLSGVQVVAAILACSELDAYVRCVGEPQLNFMVGWLDESILFELNIRRGVLTYLAPSWGTSGDPTFETGGTPELALEVLNKIREFLNLLMREISAFGGHWRAGLAVGLPEFVSRTISEARKVSP